jgi:hemerythrin superfamily protein
MEVVPPGTAITHRGKGRGMASNLVDVIIADHREVEEAFGELESGGGSPQQRRDLADHVIAELVRHSVAEEQYMYPVVREVLPDGDELADEEIEEHSEAEQVMKSLDGVDAEDPRFDELLGQLIADVRHHVEDEEQKLLPRLREACSEEQLRELGDKVTEAKKTAPTRPHPSAPDTPPLNKLLDPGAGLVDRMRDRLTGRTT